MIQTVESVVHVQAGSTPQGVAVTHLLDTDSCVNYLRLEKSGKKKETRTYLRPRGRRLCSKRR
jgi:hypothetical protein